MLRHIGILYVLISTKCFISAGDVPIGVNGLLNQSILLLLSVNTSHPVEQVFWNYQTHIMAFFTNNQFTVINYQFEGRLDLLDNGRALRIRQLTLNDGGLYTATLTFTEKTQHKASFNLTVYEPVPTPSIRCEKKIKASDFCNVTLRCSVPTNTSSLSYTWKYRHGDSNDYQLYNNSGDTIQISLQPESWSTEVLCKVHNPADQKNISLRKFCQDYPDKGDTAEGKSRGNYTFLALLVVPLVFMGWFLLEMIKKRNKEPEGTNSEEIHYAELASLNVSNQVLKKDCNPTEETSEGIVYSTLRRDTD
ncbi:SLAM family member 9-like isoform X1 [Aquarana catesbeiana]|uniref:SLAM family member 9-like isoform X1 n=1 Tax=Aquarana catesbeiana TaxID=8400 RepID=UPI003CC9B8AD